MARTTSAAVAPGSAARTSAAIPDACGAAIEVPSKLVVARVVRGVSLAGGDGVDVVGIAARTPQLVEMHAVHDTALVALHAEEGMGVGAPVELPRSASASTNAPPLRARDGMASRTSATGEGPYVEGVPGQNGVAQVEVHAAAAPSYRFRFELR